MELGGRAWNPFDPSCPSRRLLDRIGDRWTVLAVTGLGDETLRFTELRDRVGGVSHKMLTQTLRELERDGLVERTVHPVFPPKVEYALTPTGRSLLEPLRALLAWAIDHTDAVAASREDSGEAVAGS